ncbi:MAG: FMN-binding protein [bacterium]
MKKYTQIIIVLAAFFLIVYFRRLNDVNNPQIATIDNPNQQVSNSSFASSVATNSNTVNQNQNAVAPPIATNPNPVNQNQNTAVVVPSGKFKDSVYAGSSENASYGNVQVQFTVSNGFITNLIFLQYPNNDKTSQKINTQAMPVLISEVIQSQGGNVNGVSGASYTSVAFNKSLSNALSKAI